MASGSRLVFLLSLSFIGHCLSYLPQRSSELPSSNSSFARAIDSQFFINEHPFFVNGYNAYWLTYYSYQLGTRPHVTDLFQQAAALGLNVARTWAFNDGGYLALHVSPAVYDEVALQGLDFVIAEAQTYGMMLILSLSNNYNDYGGKAQYVQWARDAGHSVYSDDAFFYDPVIKGFYKEYVKTILTRNNTVTGVAYSDDPTIFAWELINEPRCPYDPSGETLLAWIEEMSSFVKSIDSNHMVEVGMEGFYSSPHQNRSAGLGDWACELGTDFIRHNLVPDIDFATVHSYPEFWMPQESFESQLSFVRRWIRNHVEDAVVRLRKPVLFAEFGKSSRSRSFEAWQRDRFFAAVYAAIFDAGLQDDGGRGTGALLWQLLPNNSSIALELDDGFGISASIAPSTLSLVASQSQRVTMLNTRALVND